MSTAPSSNDLYTPTTLGDLTLSNRVVMAPLTRSRAGARGIPGPVNATYYAQRASAGLIISEATQISPTGIGYPDTPGIHDAQQVAGWKQVTDAVHARGGRIFLQLWHVGRISHPVTLPPGETPVAPSAIRPAGEIYTREGMKPFVTPRALTTDEIAAVVEDYRRAALNARDAGFDGVEIHAANGYLIDQFLRDGTNHRTDAYGGSIENRVRFLHEVTRAVLTVWPASRVGVRLSPVNPFNDIADSQPQPTFEFVASSLAPFKLAYLHVVENADSRFDFARLRAAFDGAYIACGGYDAQRAEHAIAQRRADFVAFGTLFIANPDLPARLRARGPYNTPEPSSYYAGDAKGYIDYPSLQERVQASPVL